jgi:FkbM family methyltransferase
VIWYSDNDVDRVLVEVLLPRFGIEQGHAVDVGANNGVLNSNTLVLEESGWTVLCIEPNPALAEAGRALRNLWRQIACGPKDEEEREFWAYSREHPTAASSSALVMENGQVPHGYGPPSSDSDRSMVKVRTLDRVLDEAGFPKVDLVSIDVEGYEKEVLAGFDIERWKPAILIVESISYELEPPPGYRVQGRYQFDNLFIRE